MRFDLDQIISQVGRDKGIKKEVLVQALESAVLSAAKKHFGHNRNLEATYNTDLGEIEVIEFRTVVDDVKDSATQMTLAEARKEYDSECEVGDELGRKLDASVLGRIAAQTAKQVITQKLRDAERDNIFTEYHDRKGELVNGIVQRFDRGNIIVNLGRTDAVLPEREQIKKERYRQGDRIRSMILDIDPNSRGSQIVLTRSHPEFMRKLFSVEVPEIAENIVEIKSVGREPGERAKIAVYSNDPSVDATGACIGIKGCRVQAVSTELRGEKIDIVAWYADAPSFVAKALFQDGSKDVERIFVDEEEHSMEVVVADAKLAQAIGRKGLNVKLASKLTGWRIDVRSQTAVEEEQRRARTALESIPGIGFTEAEFLFQYGYQSVNDVANASPEDLSSVEGIDAARANELIGFAQKYLDEHRDAYAEEDAHRITDIDQLILPQDLKDILSVCGYDRIQSLAALSAKELCEQTGMQVRDSEKVVDAVEKFLRAQQE
ncbi:MAG: transcription termination factor NusA [Deltaproteobacteria bacterium]|nr:transcription termination factor NusA [Deltaproteobacteria bacterium]